jgi:hypothetical protein
MQLLIKPFSIPVSSFSCKYDLNRDFERLECYFAYTEFVPNLLQKCYCMVVFSSSLIMFKAIKLLQCK